MNSFNYKAINKKGKIVKGNVEAADMESARQALMSEELSVIRLTNASAFNKNIEIGSGKIKSKEIPILCTQLYQMLKAGVPIVDAIKLASGNSQNKIMKKILQDVAVSIGKGESLANSLAKYPKSFPPIMVSMTNAGEESGTLPQALLRVSDQLEKSEKTKKAIKGAMIYPVALLAVCAVVVVVMLLVVIPNYENMFADLDTEMPAITQAFINMSAVLKSKWFVIFPVIFALIYGIVRFTKTDKGRHIMGKLVLKLPIIKDLVIKNHSAQFSRTMSALLGSGLPLIKALQITSSIMSNVWFKEAVEKIKEDVTIGSSMASSIAHTNLFPQMLTNMVKIGEESGSTEEMLVKLAEYYESEVDGSVEALKSAMQPAIILVMTGIVGVMIAACMAPMLTMYQSMGNL